MAAYVYNEDDQDLIAYGVWRCAYADLETAQKNQQDGGWTTGAPGGVVGQVSTMLANTAAMLLGDADAVPEEWSPWLIAESQMTLVGQLRLDGFREMRAIARDRRATALQTVSRRDIDDSAVSSDITVQSLARLIMPGLAAAGIYVNRDEFDHAVIATLGDLWSRREWTFRVVQVTGTINTDQTVTVTSPSGLTFDGLSTLRMALRGTGLTNTDYEVRHCTRDDIARLRSKQSLTGAPRYFHLSPSSSNPDTMAWEFYPVPDQQYTFDAAMQRAYPGVPSNATDAGPFNDFPDEFRALFQLGIQATLKRMKNVSGWMDDQREYERQVDEMGTRYAGQGFAHLEHLAGRDVYQDHQHGLRRMDSYLGEMGGAM